MYFVDCVVGVGMWPTREINDMGDFGIFQAERRAEWFGSGKGLVFVDDREQQTHWNLQRSVIT